VSTALADKALGALGDPTRRAIVEHLSAGRLPVGAIADRLGVTSSAVSQHLKIMKEARLVDDRKEGTRSYYHLDGAGAEAARAFFDTFWDLRLAAFKAEAERTASRTTDDPETEER
jgi:DNA-binding transcriptional ArsR family regulator